MPRPKKLSAASAKMAKAKLKEISTISRAASELGRMWRKRMRLRLAPIALAASTNSSPRTEMTALRAMRAKMGV